MIKLGRKFRFGCYTEEDLKQEAYILAWECVPRWDGKRPLGALIYSHLYNRLSLIKRMKYERIEPPCTMCPLDAYVNKKCVAYEDLEDCKYYAGWLKRNEVKKSLMNVRLVHEGVQSDSYRSQYDEIDDEDEWEYALSTLTPEQKRKIKQTGTVSIEEIEHVKRKIEQSRCGIHSGERRKKDS